MRREYLHTTAPAPADTEQSRQMRAVSEETLVEENGGQDGMRITVLNDDDEVAWPEEPTTAAVLADRQRRTRSMLEEEEDEVGWDPRYRSSYSRLRRGPRPEAQRPRAQPTTGRSSGRPSGVTSARFRIGPGKNKVAIHFNPPV